MVNCPWYRSRRVWDSRAIDDALICGVVQNKIWYANALWTIFFKGFGMAYEWAVDYARMASVMKVIVGNAITFIDSALDFNSRRMHKSWTVNDTLFYRVVEDEIVNTWALSCASFKWPCILDWIAVYRAFLRLTESTITIAVCFQNQIKWNKGSDQIIILIRNYDIIISCSTKMIIKLFSPKKLHSLSRKGDILMFSLYHKSFMHLYYLIFFQMIK